MRGKGFSSLLSFSHRDAEYTESSVHCVYRVVALLG